MECYWYSRQYRILHAFLIKPIKPGTDVFGAWLYVESAPYELNYWAPPPLLKASITLFRLKLAAFSRGG